MRSVALALFACVRMINETVPLCFQQSKQKLAWQDLPAVVALPADGKLRGAAGYASRKKAAISCAAYLLALSASALSKRGKGAGSAQLQGSLPTSECCRSMQRIFLQSAKRDDLADALLHLLAYDARERRS